ncbi:(2Fe-2S)-binding protein [Peribacillus sp. NPDC097675]|uniref:(2Fe-2S)-binding protein n=1 Tax=Peribacillus sp. NPDC097675 TaxID=3390618 RepID=UPI003CFF8FC1
MPINAQSLSIGNAEKSIINKSFMNEMNIEIQQPDREKYRPIHKLSPSIEEELQTYRISFDEEIRNPRSVDDIEELIGYAIIRSGAETPRVAASMWFRRYAFFITAQLYMISKHRLTWNGTLSDIEVLDDPEDDQWFPKYGLKETGWSDVSDKESTQALQAVLKRFGSDIINPLSKSAKVSKLILWENIWGYTVWMYSELLKQCDIKERVEKDIETLLDNEMWLNFEKRSPFKRFIGEKTIPESMNSYKRVTCCLYYQIEGQTKCSYCPNNNC